MGTESSKLTVTLSGAGSARSSSPGDMAVSSFQVPLQSSWYPARTANAASIASSRTMTGSLFSNLSRRPLSSART
jgi:hypothetical protein